MLIYLLARRYKGNVVPYMAALYLIALTLNEVTISLILRVDPDHEI